MKMKTVQYTESRSWSDPLPDWDSENTLVLVFGSSEFGANAKRFEEISARFPSSVIIGCSSSGEIFQDRVFDQSLSVAFMQFEKTNLRLISEEISNPEDSFTTGGKIAENLAGEDLKAVFVLSDGLNVNGSELVRGLNSKMASGVVVTGGLAGDGDRFEKTWVLQKDQPVSNRVIAVGLYGDALQVGHGSKGGWEQFGPKRKVTKSEGNVLHELDGQPALDLYKRYLGDKASGLPATALLFPLALKEEDGSEKVVVRTVLSVDEDEKTMTFAGDIPEGASAQLMRAHFDELVRGAGGAAEMANGGHNEPTLSIAISCVGRRLLMGEEVNGELAKAIETFPEKTQQIGFYSYGEISPYVQGQPCDLHNQTMTITTFRED